MNMRMSSAKNRCVIGISIFHNSIPYTRCFPSISNNMHDRIFTQRIKRYVDSGSPCLMPLEGMKLFVGAPLIKML